MKEEDARTTRTSRAAGRSTSPIKIVSPSGTTVLRNLRGRMEQRRRLLEKRKKATPKLKRSVSSTSADGSSKATPSSERVEREMEEEMDSNMEDSAASATPLHTHSVSPSTVSTRSVSPSTVSTRSVSPSIVNLDGTSIPVTSSDHSANKNVASTIQTASPNLTIQKPSPSVVPVKHVLRSRGAAASPLDKSSPKTGNAPITLKLNLRTRGMSPDVIAASSAAKTSHRASLSSAAASPELSSLVSQGKQGTPKTANIRTRLSTGSIQMNGTTTISSAKEKAEMEVIMKQIAKETTTHRASPGNKKRMSALSTTDARGTSDHPPPKKRKIGRNDGSGEDNRNDYFCWLCHKEGTVVCCEVCPRVYHTRCLGLTGELPEDWCCPECEKVMRAECIDTQSNAMKMLTLDQLCKLLIYALERMKHAGSEPFQTAVDMAAVPSYLDYIFYPMDLTTLEKNVRKKMYGCTEALLADAKWIQHNCIIYNGAHHKLTNSAKMIIKICKHEMNEIELCPDCYLNSCLRAEDWFSELCRVPHTLVWAKLKGYPFWPSKALREMDKHVDVRFFGAHDRSWVPVSQCFLLSKNMPTSLQKGKKNAGLDGAMDELNKHIEKLRKEFGDYEYAPFRTPYDKTDCYKPVNPKPVSAARQKIVAKQASFFTSQKSISGSVKKSAVSKTASALKSKYSAMVTQKKVADPLEYPRLGVKLIPIDLKRETSYIKKEIDTNSTAASAGSEENKVEYAKSESRTTVQESSGMETSADPDIDVNESSNIPDGVADTLGTALKDHDVDSRPASASSGDNVTLQKNPNKHGSIVDRLAQKIQALNDMNDLPDKETEINENKTQTSVSAASVEAVTLSENSTVSGQVDDQSKAVEHSASEKDQESCVKEDKSEETATEEVSGGSTGRTSGVSTGVSPTKVEEVTEVKATESKSEPNNELGKPDIDTEVKQSETNIKDKQSEKDTEVKKSETVTEVKKAETNNKDKQSENDTEIKKSETVTEVKKAETNESYRKMLESTIQNCKAKLGMEIPDEASEAEMSESGDEDMDNVSEESGSSSESEAESDNLNDSVDGKDSSDGMDAAEECDVDGDADSDSEDKPVKESDTAEISSLLKEISDVIDSDKLTNQGDESSVGKDELDNNKFEHCESLDMKSGDKCSVEAMDATKDVSSDSGKDQTSQDNVKSGSQITGKDQSDTQKETNDALSDEKKQTTSSNMTGSVQKLVESKRTELGDVVDDSVQKSHENKQKVLSDVTGSVKKTEDNKPAVLSDVTDSVKKTEDNKPAVLSDVTDSVKKTEDNKPAVLSDVTDSVKKTEDNKPAVLSDVTGLLMDCDTIDDDDSDIEQLVIDMDADSCDQSDTCEPTQSPDMSPDTSPDTFCVKGGDIRNNMDFTKSVSPCKKLVNTSKNGSTCSGLDSDKDGETGTVVDTKKSISAKTVSPIKKKRKSPVKSSVDRETVSSSKSDQGAAVKVSNKSVMGDMSRVDLTADGDAEEDSDVPIGIDIESFDDVTKTTDVPKQTAGAKASSLAAKADKVSEKFTKMLATLKQTFDDTYTEMMQECSSSSMTDQELAQLLEETNWKHQSEIKELQHNFQLTVEELRTSWQADRYGWDAKRSGLEAEKDELMIKHAKDMEAVIKETKKKQWCAYCQKEAMYYCCWNTSYCNYPCQQKHWAQHMEHCLQASKSGNQSGTTASTTIVTTAKISKAGGWSKPAQVLPARTAESSIADPTIASTIKMVQATVTPIAASSSSQKTRDVYRSQLKDRIDTAIQREEERRGEGRSSVSGLKYVPMSSAKSIVQNVGSVSATPPIMTTNLMYNPLSSTSSLSRQPQAPSGMMQAVPRSVFINQQIPVQSRLPHPGAHRAMGSQMVLPQSLLQQAIYPVQGTIQQQQQLGGTILFQNQQQQNIMGYGMPPRGPY